MKFIFKLLAALSIIFLLIIVAFFVMYVYLIPRASMRPIEKIACSGKIISIKDSSRFCYIAVEEVNKITRLETSRMCDNSNVFFLSIAPGDSLIKQKGEFSLTIIRKGYTTRHIYDYPMCFY